MGLKSPIFIRGHILCPNEDGRLGSIECLALFTDKTLESTCLVTPQFYMDCVC